MAPFLCGWNPFSRWRANLQPQAVVPPSTPQVLIELVPTPTSAQVIVPPATVHPPTVDPPPQIIDVTPVSQELGNLALSPTVTQIVVSSPAGALPPQIEDPKPNVDPKESIDPTEIQNIREKCPQFRVLLMGKANSGKTTIIEKMGDSNQGEVPVVRDEYGRILDASVLEKSKAMRGIHDIHREITYESNPNFVFHDSRGFEAGSIEEFGWVKEFIKKMLAERELRHRLHAIWYCVPLDSTRVASKAELSFFEENIGDIPVILVFTKWDGQVIRAFNKLEYDENKGIAQAKKEAPGLARAILEEEYIPVFRGTLYPPAAYAVLGYMNKPETKCSELAEKTAAALNNTVLKKLFVSVQTHNLQLCIENGICSAVSNYIFSPSSNIGSDPNNAILDAVLSWFPHCYSIHDYSQVVVQVIQGLVAIVPILKTFKPALIRSEQALSSLLLQRLNNAAATAIVATRSFHVKQRGESTEDAFKASNEEYLASSQYHEVKTAITSKFGQYAESSASDVPWETRKDISEELVQICLNNLLD